MESGEVRPGTYRHYKGQDYQVMTLAMVESSHERVVVYRALYDSREFGNNAVWVRPLSEFTQDVQVDGKTIPRFRRISD